LTNNQDLRQLFTYIWLIYSTPPSISSNTFHLAVLEHYKNGIISW